MNDGERQNGWDEVDVKNDWDPYMNGIPTGKGYIGLLVDEVEKIQKWVYSEIITPDLIGNKNFNIC